MIPAKVYAHFWWALLVCGSSTSCILRSAQTIRQEQSPSPEASPNSSPTPASPAPAPVTGGTASNPSPIAGPSPSSGPPATRVDNSTDANDVVKYARLCKQELGISHLPKLPPWNCLEGKELPVTIQDQPLNASNYALLTSHKIACDHPSWLGSEPCANYGFVTHRTLAPNVEAYLICRDQKFSTYKDRATRLADLKASSGADSFNSYYAFDSLGMIWTNTKTGKTCFFDYVGMVYGGYVPSPDDDHVPDYTELPDPKPPTELATGSIISSIWKRNARGTWRAPDHIGTNDSCTVCHDTGPLKGTPWISQVMDIPSNPTQVPMLVVGSALAGWKEKYPIRAISTTPVTVNGKSEPQICTTCHRIGSQSTCKTDLAYSIGLAIPPNVPTTAAKDFFHRVWMPPADSSWKGKSDAELNKLWNDAYGPHIKRMSCCCKNPDAINCTSQDILTFPLPRPVAGKGPEVCN